jgi:hypothetical protein
MKEADMSQTIFSFFPLQCCATILFKLTTFVLHVPTNPFFFYLFIFYNYIILYYLFGAFAETSILLHYFHSCY